MHIEVLSVCRRPPRWVSDTTAEYAKRLPRDFTLGFDYLAPGQERVSTTVRKRDEATRLLKRVADDQYLIALDEHGSSATSEQFAASLGKLREQARKIVLIIGGADGLDEAVLARADACWTLSALTLPHLLVQVLLAEQIYRAWTILEQHPYHRS